MAGPKAFISFEVEDRYARAVEPVHQLPQLRQGGPEAQVNLSSSRRRGRRCSEEQPSSRSSS